MASQEAKQFVSKAWDALWTSDLSTISEFYDESAEMSAFSPPKQTTWKGIDEIKAHCLSLRPVISSKSFTITNLDLVAGDANALYATWEAVWEVKIPGQEAVMEQRGILHCVRKNGKLCVWTMYEDPTPFVAMAMAGQMPSELPK
ncbi:hypothetical protein NA56DRAFT_709279 [Hyaloscypha hepaticicola]|uniref:SnoaL-like domain-containing protein n=1 Tax=Hyaloscypha hepaticicola TaxID=2082293 RepID=A0A2J6PPF3_9HELO|nr:hypothetical protein NA56DRAFT_709279 [Hyaloscypha hepaticicola]